MIVTDLLGDTYKLGFFGKMTQSSGSVVRYTTRAKYIRHAANGHLKIGMKNTGFFLRDEFLGYVGFKLTFDGLEMGCKAFSHNEADKILRWARVI